MELRKIIRTDIAASAIAHLTLVALIIVISKVHPFHPAPSETVAVDIVTPEQVKQEEAKAEEKALAKAQRRLAKETKGTPNRHKRRKVVARGHERTRWRRQA